MKWSPAIYPLKKGESKRKVYHNFSNFYRIISIQIKLECDHFPVMGFQLTFSNSVPNIRNLQKQTDQ